MRKLASIQVIREVEPIPGADAIERVRVLGWSVVVRKGEYRVGDKVVYCEIDSLLPERPEFEFLRKSCYRAAIVSESTGETLLPAGFRIKTVRLRGQVSQGICLALGALPDGVALDEGADVTAALGIVKFDPPVSAALSGRVKGNFPGGIPKTDETRVQVLEGVLARHRGKTFYLTEKVDGASCTAFVRDGAFGLCSRNLWIDETDLTHSLCALAHATGLADKLARVRDALGFDLAVQGELLGPGVQGNKYGLRALTWRVFNVVDVSRYQLVDHAQMLDIVHRLELTAVPQLGTLTLDHTVDQLVELSAGPSALTPAVPREGIVLRPLRDEHDPELGRLSFKVINPRFLLKYEE